MRIQLFIILVFGFTAANAQNKWQFSAGWSLTRTYAKADGKQEVVVQQLSTVTINPRYSVQWTLDKEKSHLKPLENILRLGVLSLQLEKRMKRGLSFATGLETGGRYFDVTEWPMDGRNDGKYNHYANIARRSYLVTSIPLVFKLDIPYRAINFRAVGGLYLNYEMAVKQNTLFYKAARDNSFYPTLHAGIEITKWNNKGLVFEMAYQQGFYNILDDWAVVNSVLFRNNAPADIRISSAGSHLRVGLRYNFAPGILNRKKTEKPVPPNPAEIPFEDRRISKTLHFNAEGGTIRLCFFDDQTVDHDTVTVVYNDSLILDQHGLTLEPKCVTINMQDGGPVGVLYIHALNEGSIRPNTLKVEYTTSAGTKFETVRLGLDNSVKIIIYNRY